ncbi:MAG TPA: PAS domain-containing protein, partial [Acidimicrobiales bacterium]|nr:PAS domain-containing protein [Acidimicrobiales bacterium]
MADEGEGRSDAARVGPEAHPQRRADLEHPLRATVDLAARLAAPGDVTKVVQAAADAVVDAFGARLAQVWLAEGPGRLRLAARAGGPLAGDPPSPVMDVATEASLVADVARARLPLVTSDVVGPFAPPLADGPPVAAAALLPMLAEEGEPAGPGRLLGVVAGWFSAPVPVDTADVLSALVSVVAGAVHHADLVERERRGRVDRPAGTGDDREHRLLSFVDSVDAVLLEADPATLQLSFVSRRAEQLLGYPVHRWLEPGFWAATVHPADRDYAVRCSQLAGAQGGDHEFECRMVGADGREVWVQNLVP